MFKSIRKMFRPTIFSTSETVQIVLEESIDEDWAILQVAVKAPKDKVRVLEQVVRRDVYETLGQHSPIPKIELQQTLSPEGIDTIN
jgi:hypothetical protein